MLLTTLHQVLSILPQLKRVELAVQLPSRLEVILIQVPCVPMVEVKRVILMLLAPMALYQLEILQLMTLIILCLGI